MKLGHLISIACAIILISICGYLLYNFFKKKPTNAFNEDLLYRMEILENRMDINRELMGKLKLEMDSLSKIKNQNETKIIRIRSNRGANNELISSLSSLELSKALADRYKDSIK